VKELTYKKIECVVVDNGSTDGRSEIIKEAIGSDPKFTFVQSAENLGHLGAALYLLDRLTGDFVTFLDADDVLSPDYVAIHVQVHLASRVSTGFSSSNHFHINAEGAILSAGNPNLGAAHAERVPAAEPLEGIVLLQEYDEDLIGARREAARRAVVTMPSAASP
jgi:glycosyltransferase involved in cell wall biosynthesis